jgi:hypothetical protein
MTCPEYVLDADIDAAIERADSYLKLPMKTGVYLMCNRVTGRIYIGRATTMRRRAGAHICELRNGRCLNADLAHDFSLYGEKAFLFAVLIECEKPWDWLIEREAIALANKRPMYNKQGKTWLVSQRQEPATGA